MTREIKFRVFVKPTGKRYREGMHDDQVFLFKDNFDWEFNPNKTLFRLAQEYPDNYVLMQFTGKKDLHGKEIYEGDIVNHPAIRFPFVSEGGEIGEVRYIEQNCGFFIIGKGWTKHNNWSKHKELWAIESCEVIGNIWEHPHLLKAK